MNSAMELIFNIFLNKVVVGLINSAWTMWTVTLSPI